MKQAREKFETSGGKFKNSPLTRFHVLTSILRRKPYGFSLLADKSREVVNREFFERQVINSNKYAGNFGLKNKYIPINFSFSNSAKTIDRIARPSQDFDDEEVNLNINNESASIGETHIDLAKNKFSRTEEGTPDQEGTAHTLDLANQKFLSADEKKSLSSFLNFYGLKGTSESKVFNLNENLSVKHTDYLDSSYTYNFSDRSSSGINSRDNRVSTTLRHRLYKSLTSSFTPYYFKSDADNFSQDSYGASLDEDYVKRLGKIGRLRSGIGINYFKEKRETSDSVISIIDEPHTLTTGIITFLNKPNVETTTVVVTNSTGAITFTLNVDYQLINAGEQTQIQRIASGSISNGEEVLVDYQAKSGSLEFNTLGENFRVRLDFLDELIGVFFRINKETHPRVSGQDVVILQTFDDRILGLDFNYKNLNIEIEDEFFDSTLSPYRQQRFRESYFFNPTEKSTLTFQSSQSKVQLINTGDKQNFFDFLIRYSAGLNKFSRLTSEAGLRYQEISGFDLSDIALGSSYELNLGKFLMNIKYDFRKQLYLDDELINHFFSINIKREL